MAVHICRCVLWLYTYVGVLSSITKVTANTIVTQPSLKATNAIQEIPLLVTVNDLYGCDSDTVSTVFIVWCVPIVECVNNV